MKFDEAKAAHEAGQEVEFRWKSSHGENPWMLVKALFGPQNREEDIRSTYEFRLAPGQEPDPYAEYKAAQKAGKVIQIYARLASEPDGKAEWGDDLNPQWCVDPKFYRVKPEEPALVIEPGKEYRHAGYKLRSLCTDSPGPLPFIFIDNSGQIWRFGSEQIKLLTFVPWTAAPVILDNWRHLSSWAKWQALDENGDWCYFQDKPDKGSYSWYANSNYWGLIPATCRPTNFTGTWESSLQERPE